MTGAARKGFLLVLMQCPPALEEEFNAWYDTEHIPERLAVPGFLTGLRFISLSGHPRYLAMYDLERADVLESEAYQKVAHDRSSPWTKRVTSRVRIYRSAGDQVWPGNLVTGTCARLALLRFRNRTSEAEKEIVSGLRANFEGRPETIQTRLLAYKTGSSVDYLGLVEARAPLGDQLDLKAFGRHADAVDLVNVYAPY
ncbi:MAG TPA: hypothetical protein VFV47_09920 [Hyphomicrobiaceae bacterium]|nr:hypothetical protein [Hyphomicrobiaceae bacterium]